MPKIDLDAIEVRLRDGWTAANIRDDVLALIEEVKRQRKLLDKWGRQATKQRQKRHALSNVLE